MKRPIAPSDRNLILIGFMATGKSTIGRRCADALGFRFHDSDALVERRAGLSVSSIFEQQGEAAFREQEDSAIRDLAHYRRCVIATGGGAVMNTTNVARLRRSGCIILLWSEPSEILARCGTRMTRPILASAADPARHIAELLAIREPHYRAAAHKIVDTTGLSRDEAVSRVLSAYRGHLESLTNALRPA